MSIGSDIPGKQTLRLALKIESMNKPSLLDHEDGSPSDG